MPYLITTEQINTLTDLLCQIGASATVTATILDDDGYGTTVTRRVLGPSSDGQTVRLAPTGREVVARVRGLVEIDVLTVNGHVAYNAVSEGSR